MNVQDFLNHHQITRNPFAEEDAQTDPVFKDYCIDHTYHPTWAKVYGEPQEPSTAVVFGEKGAGKTAMRLQIARHLMDFNKQHPDQRLFVIHYDDFNPFLDRFREKVGPRQRADRVLAKWRLWDHMDAILSLGVTGLVDRILGVKPPSKAVMADVSPDAVAEFDHHQARDLLLLAACYDQSTASTFSGRWHALRRKLKYWPMLAHWPLAAGIGWSVLAGVLLLVLTVYFPSSWLRWWWVYLLVFGAGWAPYLLQVWRTFLVARGVRKRMRVGQHETNLLRQALMNFTHGELAGQPFPNKDRTDDRYELLGKFQSLLELLGFKGVVVLVDRVDEPHLINGSAELMKLLVWPMLDNKFLKHAGLGVKLMLPIELQRFVEREDRNFYQRARLDKQNMVASFEWTGPALHDVANARIQACAADGAQPTLRDLLDPAISDQRVLDAMRQVRVPRHLFKFLYRLLVRHCNAHTDLAPAWTITRETFESELAVFGRDQDAFERGIGAG